MAMSMSTGNEGCIRCGVSNVNTALTLLSLGESSVGVIGAMKDA